MACVFGLALPELVAAGASHRFPGQRHAAVAGRGRQVRWRRQWHLRRRRRFRRRRPRLAVSRRPYLEAVGGAVDKSSHRSGGSRADGLPDAVRAAAGAPLVVVARRARHHVPRQRHAAVAGRCRQSVRCRQRAPRRRLHHRARRSLPVAANRAQLEGVGGAIGKVANQEPGRGGRRTRHRRPRSEAAARLLSVAIAAGVGYGAPSQQHLAIAGFGSQIGRCQQPACRPPRQRRAGREQCGKEASQTALVSTHVLLLVSGDTNSSACRWRSGDHRTPR